MTSSPAGRASCNGMSPLNRKASVRGVKQVPDDCDGASGLKKTHSDSPARKSTRDPELEIVNRDEELFALRSELAQLKSSIRFQLGTLLVEAVSSRHSARRLPIELFRTARRCVRLWHASRIATSIITGLPDPVENDVYGELGDARILKRLARLVGEYDPSDQTSRALAEISQIASGSWLKRIVAQSVELDGYVRTGFPLPEPKAGTRDGVEGAVFYLIHSDPLIATNGYTRRTHELVSALSSSRWNVVPIVRPTPAAAEAGGRVIAYEGRGYLRLALNNGWRGGLGEYIASYTQQLLQLAAERKPKLIHAASNFINGLAGVTVARKLGVPFIYEVRGLWEITRSSQHAGFAKSLGYHAQARLELAAANAADAVIAANQDLGEELQRRGVDASVISIVPSGAPEMPESSPERRRQLREAFDLPQDAFVIGYVGSLVWYEGLETLLSAAAALSRTGAVHVFVVGHGPMRGDLIRLAQRLGLEKAVTFAGLLTPKAAQSAYQAIDLAVYPRSRVAVTNIVSPLKHLEALAAGTPVIVSDVSPLRRFAEKTGVVEVVPADNSPALATAIGVLMQSPARRNELGKMGRNWALQQGSWRVSAQSIVERYDALTMA
jgi:glycosyltransferase involved in cell wall biosynthesis